MHEVWQLVREAKKTVLQNNDFCVYSYKIPTGFRCFLRTLHRLNVDSQVVSGLLAVIESRLFLCQTVCYVKRSPAEIHFQTTSLQATSSVNTGGIDYKNREWKTCKAATQPTSTLLWLVFTRKFMIVAYYDHMQTVAVTHLIFYWVGHYSYKVWPQQTLELNYCLQVETWLREDHCLIG